MPPEGTNYFTRPQIEFHVSGLVPNISGDILLVRSKALADRWILPGGKVKFGSDFTQSCVILLKRKLWLDLEPEIQEPIRWGSRINIPELPLPNHFIGVDILFKPTDQEPLLDCEDYKCFEWFQPQRALGLPLATGYEQAIDTYLRTLGSSR